MDKYCSGIKNKTRPITQLKTDVQVKWYFFMVYIIIY